MGTVYHEQNLSETARNVHRALASLQEELEATDWYNQRMDVATDPALKEILEHNRNEEIEHAAMLLEYLRRNMPDFDAQLGTYLFTNAPITEIEDEAEGGDGDDGDDRVQPGAAAPGSLGIGKLA